MVSILPFYVGWVLGSHQLFPGQAAGLGLANGTTGLRDAAATILGAARPVLLGAVVMGPLLWTATLLINDVYDLPGDRLNARKARSPLVQGLVSRGWANGAAYVFAGLCLAASWPLGWGMRLAVLGNLVLAWAYSVPPVRLGNLRAYDPRGCRHRPPGRVPHVGDTPGDAPRVPRRLVVVGRGQPGGHHPERP